MQHIQCATYAKKICKKNSKHAKYALYSNHGTNMQNMFKFNLSLRFNVT